MVKTNDEFDDGLYASDREPNDPVDDALLKVRALLVGADVDQALLAIDRGVRQRWGGAAVYVAKVPRGDTIARLVRRDLAAGKTKKDVALTYSLSVRTVQRWTARDE
ncbi:hypothetical protein [Accumulibacter sp.]|uniref:hypothetical protein n=1 Tax=Accumulibacter sp. TaxID=2053492 RepID=UPI00262AE964|nr:hypothetical protein [Accumulibacter sp.]